MNITEELKVKIQHIVDSVPISYYCGQRISLCLDPESLFPESETIREEPSEEFKRLVDSL